MSDDSEFPEPESADSFDDFAASPFDAESPAASDGGGGPQAAATRWYRSEERVISGVAGGLAESTALDPVLVRLGFVGLTLLDGVGILAYLAAALMMSNRRGAPVRRGLWRVGGLAVLGLGGVLLAGRVWGGDPGSGVFILALIGVAASLWHPRRRGQGPPSSSSGGSTWPSGWAPPDPALAPQASRPIVVLPQRAPRERQPKPPRSPLGRIALAVALAAIVIGASVGDGTPRSMKIAFTVAAIICGVGLLIGAFIGRARWLIIPGLLAVGGAVMSQAVEGLGVHMGFPIGGSDNYQIVEDTSQLRDVNIGSGSYHVDIYKLTEDASLTARVGIGGVYIGVPAKARVTLTSQVGIGSISTPQTSSDGYRRTVTQTFGPEGGPRLRLDLTAGVGTVEVFTIASEEPFRPVNPTVIENSPVVPDGAILTIPALPPGVAQIDEQGGLLYQTGAYQYPDGSLSLPDGTTIEADRTLHLAPGATVLTDGRVQLVDSTVITPTEGIVQLPDGTFVFIRPPTETRPPEAPPFITIAPVITAVPIQPVGTVADGTPGNTITTVSPATIPNGATP